MIYVAPNTSVYGSVVGIHTHCRAVLPMGLGWRTRLSTKYFVPEYLEGTLGQH